VKEITNMNVIISKKENGTLVKLEGNLDGHSSDEVTEKLLNEITEKIELTIDMDQCQYVSSAGLRTLLTVGKTVRMNEGKMYVINLKEEVEDVMVMTGFSKIFEGFEK